MKTETLWILITIVGTLGAIVCGLGLRSLCRRLSPFRCPQLQFRYKGNEAAAQLDTLCEGKLALFDRFSLLMIPMMLEALLILLAVSRNATQIGWLLNAMYALSGLISLFGIAETIAVRLRKLSAASALSLIKWGAFALWTLGMFAGLFIQSTKF